MERVDSNNLFVILGRAWHRTFRKLVYPGLRLSYAGICDCFLFSLFVLPSYFGIRLGFFDLTAFRLFEICLLILIWKKEERRNQFLTMVRKCPHTIYIALYMFIVTYTNIYRPSVSTIFYWLMNGVFAFFLVAFLLINEYGAEGFLQRIRTYTWVLCLLSPLEIVIHRSPFSLLDTLGKSSHTLRFGVTRIVGNCTAANGYAMYLCILLPFICYDIKRKRIDVMKNVWLVLLLLVNVFLTGSRLSVGIGLLEVVICLLFQDKRATMKFLLTVPFILPVLVGALFLFRGVPLVNSILMAFFSAFDEVFNTAYSVNFGADATMLYNSSHYREVLVRETFGGDWLNPIMGRGGNYEFSMYVEGYFIRSVDNFYVGQFITYAYPGLFAWLLMSAGFLVSAIRNFFKNRNFLTLAAAISIIGYFISLWYLDQLQTFPIMFAIFALVYASSVLERRARKGGASG
ncbi:MAG: hypothetical protein ACSW8H_01545 [bacterium]